MGEKCKYGGFCGVSLYFSLVVVFLEKSKENSPKKKRGTNVSVLCVCLSSSAEKHVVPRTMFYIYVDW